MSVGSPEICVNAAARSRSGASSKLTSTISRASVSMPTDIIMINPGVLGWIPASIIARPTAATIASCIRMVIIQASRRYLGQ